MYRLSKLIVPTVCLFGIVSCGADKPDQPTAKQQTANSSTETNQKKSDKSEYVSPLPDTAPTFTVAIEQDDYPPFEYRNEYGTHIGYDFDLIRAIGEEAGFKVQINTVPFVEVLPSLNTNTNDIAISALTASEERVSNFEASSPYIKSASNFVVVADSEYQEAAQIADKNVATQKDSFQETKLKADSNSYNIIPTKTNYLAFQAIFTGKADALYADKTMTMYLAEQFPENKVKYIPHGEDITLSIFTKKGNNEVMAKVNEGLKILKSNGRYQELNKKWFGNNANTITIK